MLSLACFPDGDLEIPLPRVMRTLSNQDLDYEERHEPTHPPTAARTWTDALERSVVNVLIVPPQERVAAVLPCSFSSTGSR